MSISNRKLHKIQYKNVFFFFFSRSKTINKNNKLFENVRLSMD